MQNTKLVDYKDFWTRIELVKKEIAQNKDNITLYPRVGKYESSEICWT